MLHLFSHHRVPSTHFYGRPSQPCQQLSCQSGGALHNVSRTRLRTRVLLLTSLFALALFAIAFGLSWRAKVAEERWSRLVGVETRAIAALEELVRAQNAFNAQRRDPAQYRLVAQLLQDPSLRAIDVAN